EMPLSGEMVAMVDPAAAMEESDGAAVSVAITDAEASANGLSALEAADAGALAAADVSIRAAEAEAGKLYVAGEAPPGALVHIYADEEFVGEARAGREGRWLVEAETDVPVGEVVIRADAKVQRDTMAAAEAELPFIRYPDGIVLEPVMTASRGSLSAAATLPTPAYVIIRRGDNLWRIARRNYGRGIKYHAIFEANRDRIRNPHWIFPGQVFIVPARDRGWTASAN
ncbi:MAG TPA: LysM peptidoglycan-binding domain-containing protein, partial [Propylenella sp.]